MRSVGVLCPSFYALGRHQEFLKRQALSFAEDPTSGYTQLERYFTSHQPSGESYAVQSPLPATAAVTPGQSVVPRQQVRQITSRDMLVWYLAGAIQPHGVAFFTLSFWFCRCFIPLVVCLSSVTHLVPRCLPCGGWCCCESASSLWATHLLVFCADEVGAVSPLAMNLRERVQVDEGGTVNLITAHNLYCAIMFRGGLHYQK